MQDDFKESMDRLGKAMESALESHRQMSNMHIRACGLRAKVGSFGPTSPKPVDKHGHAIHLHDRVRIVKGSFSGSTGTVSLNDDEAAYVNAVSVNVDKMMIDEETGKKTLIVNLHPEFDEFDQLIPGAWVEIMPSFLLSRRSKRGKRKPAWSRFLRRLVSKGADG